MAIRAAVSLLRELHTLAICPLQDSFYGVYPTTCLSVLHQGHRLHRLERPLELHADQKSLLYYAAFHQKSHLCTQLQFR
jgi:hypothetical protein